MSDVPIFRQILMFRLQPPLLVLRPVVRPVQLIGCE